MLPASPLCPNCGARLGAAPAPRRNRGVWLLLAGLIMTVVGFAGFFFGCIFALSNPSGGAAASNLFGYMLIGAMILGGAGLVTMVVGFIWAIVEAARR